jgi:predicted nucleic-acid-binding protein
MPPRPCSLDTSVLLRLLVEDPLPQFQLAAQFLEEQLNGGGMVHADNVVLAEAYFAMQTAYGIPKAEALEILARFVRHSGVAVTPAASATLSLPNLARAKPGFVDRLIHGESQDRGNTLVTFEKAASKLPGTVVLRETAKKRPAKVIPPPHS